MSASPSLVWYEEGDKNCGRGVESMQTNTKELSKSTRKFIRVEKARIRRMVSDSTEQVKLVNELYRRFR